MCAVWNVTKGQIIIIIIIILFYFILAVNACLISRLSDACFLIFLDFIF